MGLSYSNRAAFITLIEQSCVPHWLNCLNVWTMKAAAINRDYVTNKDKDAQPRYYGLLSITDTVIQDKNA